MGIYKRGLGLGTGDLRGSMVHMGVIFGLILPTPRVTIVKLFAALLLAVNTIDRVVNGAVRLGAMSGLKGNVVKHHHTFSVMINWNCNCVRFFSSRFLYYCENKIFSFSQ